MASSLYSILFYVFLLGPIPVMLIPPILVLRGKRFWAPWAMIVSIVVFVLSLGGLIGAQVYYSKLMMAKSRLDPEWFSSPENERLAEQMQLGASILGVVITVATIAYAVGFLGVALRWRQVAVRAKELEDLTAQLAANRE